MQVTLYWLGDSVMRQAAASFAQRFGGGDSVSQRAAKARCDKSLPNSSAASQSRYGSAATSPRTGLCHFPAPGFDTVFMWFQWLSTPPPVIPQWTANPSKQQPVDACSPYVLASPRTALEDCLADTFRGSRPTDVLVLRVGMQYILYGSPSFAPTACVGATQSCGPIEWELELRHGLAGVIPLVHKLFPGRIVWWLLTPLWTPGWPQPAKACKPPLLDVGRHVARVNTIVREELSRRAGADGVADPRAQTSGLLNHTRSFSDCIHLLRGSAVERVTLEQLARVLWGSSPVSRLNSWPEVRACQHHAPHTLASY